MPLVTVPFQSGLGTKRTEALAVRSWGFESLTALKSCQEPLLYCQVPLVSSTSMTAIPDDEPAMCPEIKSDTKVPALFA